MNFPFFIAKRYLFSKHTTNAVNIITGVSLLGVAVGAAAMIIVLSGFNGLENLIRGFYNTFDPDVKIELVQGKNFEVDASLIDKINKVEGVRECAVVLEEKALFRYQDREFIATIKGVDEHYLEVTNFEKGLVAGEFFPPNETENIGILGAGIAYHLGISKVNYQNPVELYVPKSDASILDPNGAISQHMLYPIGLFSVQPEFDLKYAIVPLRYAQSLTHLEGHASLLELDLNETADQKEVFGQLENILGEGFEILDRDAQNKDVFKVLKTEGLATYLVLAFIILIASFGILGSNTMLVLDKREDIKTLWHLGASEKHVKRIFFTEGILTSFIGGVIGVGLGIGIVLAQQQFGLVSLGEGYVVNAYPVELRFQDFFLVISTVFGLGLLSSLISVWRLSLDKL